MNQEDIATSLYIQPRCTFIENIDGNLQCTRWDNSYGASPSFDCYKATTVVEQLICQTPELTQLDIDMAAAYQLAIQDLSPADQHKLLHEQREWLKSRAKACGLMADKHNQSADKECLIASYKSRIASIKRNY